MLPLFLRLYQNVTGANFVLGWHCCHFLVVAGTHVGVSDLVDDLLLEVVVVQSAVFQEFHASLEFRSLIELLGLGLGRKRLDVNNRGQSGQTPLIVGQTRKLGIEVRGNLIDILLRDLGAVDCCQYLVGIRLRSIRLSGVRLGRVRLAGVLGYCHRGNTGQKYGSSHK